MEERYARQTMLPEIGEQGQRRLSEASVLIVGIGGLGSAAALYPVSYTHFPAPPTPQHLLFRPLP